MNRIKVFVIATFSAISGLMTGAALGNQAAPVQQPQHFEPSPVVLRPVPVPVKSGANFVTVVTSYEGLMRLTLRALDARDYAARHDYAVAIAAVCDAQCQSILKDLPSTAMAVQSFGVQFVQGDTETVRNLVSQGWIKGPAY
ncbi:MAG: hypothetical protein ACYCSN_12430 [Acidobacteriaceae bacterium]